MRNLPRSATPTVRDSGLEVVRGSVADAGGREGAGLTVVRWAGPRWLGACGAETRPAGRACRRRAGGAAAMPGRSGAPGVPASAADRLGGRACGGDRGARAV